MATKGPEIVPLASLQLDAPDDRSESGALRVVEGVRPAGTEEWPTWAIAEGATPIEHESLGGLELLATASQVRQEHGEHADLDADPGQSLERLLALDAQGLLVIDPGQGYKARRIHTFEDADTSRDAQFAQVGYSTVATITRGGAPDELLEIIDDEVFDVVAPHLPGFRVSTNSDGDLEGGSYVVQVAWVFSNGLTGPLSAPQRLELDEGATDNPSTYGLVLRTGALAETTQERDAFIEKWEGHLRGVRFYLRPPITADPEKAEATPDENFSGEPMESPAYLVGEVPLGKLFEAVTYEGAQTDVWTEPVYEEAGNLISRRPAATTCFSYNRRLILGDVSYDFPRPDLKSLIEYEEGQQNAAGNQYWLTLEVQIETQRGAVRRYAEPLPFDQAGLQALRLQHGTIWYGDGAAAKWRLMYSADYDPAAIGSMAAASWQPVAIPGLNPNGQALGFTAGEGNFAYTIEPWTGDLNALEPPNTADVESSFEGPSRAYYEGSAAGSDVAFTYLDLTPYTADGERTGLTVKCSFRSEPEYDYGDSPTDATQDTFAAVRFLASDSTVVGTEYKKTTQDWYEDDVWRTIINDVAIPSGAVSAELELHAELLTAASDGDVHYLRVELEQATIHREATGPTYEEAIRPQEEKRRDRDANRVLVSGRGQLRNLQARRASYVGNSSDDRVLAFAANTRAISEGQFGEFPILALCTESIYAGHIGNAAQDVAVSRWERIATKGVLGPRAWATSPDGAVAFASRSGIYTLSPGLSGPISTDVHLSRSAVAAESGLLEELSEANAATSVAMTFYESPSGERRELWISTPMRSWCRDLDTGLWFTLDESRKAFTRLAGQLYGLGAGALHTEGTDQESTQTARIVTGPLNLGSAYVQKRLRSIGVRQGPTIEEVKIRLRSIERDGSIYDRSAGTLYKDLSSRRIKTPRGHAYRAFVELDLEGLPGQALGSLEVEYEIRRPHRMRE